jgi:hypothetical protein
MLTHNKANSALCQPTGSHTSHSKPMCTRDS